MHYFEALLNDAIQQYSLIPPVQIITHLSSVNNLNLHIQTANGDFVLKCYPDYQQQTDLDYEHSLLTWLAQQKLCFVLPLPIATIYGSLVGKTTNRLITLTPKFIGEPPEFRLLDGKQPPTINQSAYALGVALGKLHTALQAYPIQQRPTRTLFQELLNFAKPQYDPLQLSAEQLGFSSNQAHAERWAWWRSEAADLAQFVADDYSHLPRQICHNDYAPPNMLMRDGRVAAILYFEFACPAARALDVAMALRMTMQLDSNPVDPWAVAEHFCQGYAELIKLTPLEIRAMPQLISLRTAIPLIWALSKPTLPSQSSVELAIQRMQYSKNWLNQQQAQFSQLLYASFD